MKLPCNRSRPCLYSLSYTKRGKTRNYLYPIWSPYAYHLYCYKYRITLREKMLPCYRRYLFPSVIVVYIQCKEKKTRLRDSFKRQGRSLIWICTIFLFGWPGKIRYSIGDTGNSVEGWSCIAEVRKLPSQFMSSPQALR